MDIRIIINIDKMIRRESTGSPVQLADKLNLSERSVYKYLKYMREELGAPIEFSKYIESYKYCNDGEFCFKW
jgi:predicted DNA-binding transcriptional regulator YafY